MAAQDEHISEISLVDHLIDIRRGPSQRALYALIDGTGNSPALADFFRLAPNAEYFPLFLATDFEACIPHSPYLVGITREHSDYIFESGSKLKNDAIWFTSCLTLESLAPYFQSLTTVLLPNGNGVVFRYWSGQILQQYLRTLSLAQQQMFLPPIDTLYLPSRKDNHWQLLQINNDVLTKPIETSPWWTLEQSQLEAFKESDQSIQVHDLEDQLWRLHPSALDKLQPSSIPFYLAHSIETAQSLGLKSDENIAQFAALQLNQHSTFWQQQPFQPIWQKPEVEKNFAALAEGMESGNIGVIRT